MCDNRLHSENNSNPENIHHPACEHKVNQTNIQEHKAFKKSNNKARINNREAFIL